MLIIQIAAWLLVLSFIWLIFGSFIKFVLGVMLDILVSFSGAIGALLKLIILITCVILGFAVSIYFFIPTVLISLLMTASYENNKHTK